MAEFCDVMKQVKRMCEAQEDCEECPIFPECDESSCIRWNNYAEVKTVEQKVMDWAEENPEPRYPTWREWHKANFPNVECGKLCPAVFGGNPEGGCINVTCVGCLDRPIPADIADKRGIKPIGGVNDGTV